MSNAKECWFPAKKYGWGWGFPSTWQGWVVCIAYVVGVLLVATFYPPESDGKVFYSGIVGLSVILIAICWIKGEPPRWRWGSDT